MVRGVVEAKSNKFDKWSILVDGNWYSSKYEIKANKGDEVEFDDGGKKYCQKLKVVSSGSVGAATPFTGKPAPTGGKGVFPIPARDGQRSIVRQNAVTNANTLLGNVGAPYTVDDLIEVAREIEAYTTGDLDDMAAKARMESGFNPEE